MTYEERKYKNVEYLLRFPNGFCADQKYPLIFFIHGAGGRGGTLEAMKGHPEMTYSEKMEGFPFVSVAPLCPCATATWFDYFETLKELVKSVIAMDFVDRERVYVMGASMGGYTTWELAMSMPELFAAIVPICGGGMYWNAKRLVNVPVWAFHGKLDPTVLVEESEKMVNAVNKKGGNAKLTIYPENAHNAWDDTYSNPEVYRWMLTHKNSNAKEIENEYANNIKDFA